MDTARPARAGCDYILRNIDRDLWARVAVRATREGRTLRGLILWLLQLYASGRIPLK